MTRASELAKEQARQHDLEIAVAAMDPAALAAARAVEHDKYSRAYAIETYRMGPTRGHDAQRNLADLPMRGAYLDVGCGRGEMLRHAEQLGFKPVLGVEVVPALIDGFHVHRAEAHDLPFEDKSWDVVSLFDVLEHILPGDDQRVVRELLRVARFHILLTANSMESTLPDGTQLHINRRPYAEWERLLASWCAPAAVRVAPCVVEYAVSPMWRIDL